MMEIFEKTVEILRKMSSLEDIKPEDNLRNDLSLDSLLMVTLLIELEDGFDIQLEESDMNPFDLVLVSDVVDLVSKYRSDNNEKNS